MGMYPGGNVVTVIPTIATSSSSSGDVLCLTTEIPHAIGSRGSASLLKSISIYNHKDTTCDFDIVFMKNKVDMTDAAGSAVGNNSTWTEALAKSAGVLGHLEIDVSDSEINLINGLMYSSSNVNSAHGTKPLDMVITADSGSTSIYFAVIDRTGSISFGDNDLEFVFGFQYLG